MSSSSELAGPSVPPTLQAWRSDPSFNEGYRDRAVTPVELSPGHVRKVRAGILCFRETENDDAERSSGGKRIELLLVSRRSRHPRSQTSGSDISLSGLSESAGIACETFAIPAGKFEFSADCSIKDCALREAREEAGIECECVADLGWHHSKSKHDEPVETRYFLARCVQMLETWLEDGQRERVWFSAEEALQRASYRPDLRAVVAKGVHLLHHHGLDRLVDHILEDFSENYSCYKQQVGGHFCMVKPSARSLIEVESPPAIRGCSDNYILRGSQILMKPFDHCEFQFFCQLPDNRLAPLVPHFYGTKTLRRQQVESLAGALDRKMRGHSVSERVEESRAKSSLADVPMPMIPVNCPRGSTELKKYQYIVLEDLGKDFEKALFLDLKMGCRQRGARHNHQKRLRMARKAELSTSGRLGFRICGMRCMEPESGLMQKYDKYWGQKVAVPGMCEALSLFFCAGFKGASDLWQSLLSVVIQRLTVAYDLVQQLPGLRFWSSSLLVGFDGALLAKGNKEALLNSIKVKMIDFAHFQKVDSSRPDEEYLFGLSNLRLHLGMLMKAPIGEVGSQLADSLPSPPEPDMQDEEQQKAWDDLAPELRRSIGSASKDSESWEANAQTTSGATGQQLLRELAWNRLSRRPSDIMEETISGPRLQSEGKLLPKASSSTALSALANLFDDKEERL